MCENHCTADELSDNAEGKATFSKGPPSKSGHDPWLLQAQHKMVQGEISTWGHNRTTGAKLVLLP